MAEAGEAEDRPFSIIIFGASGFTGQYVVEELARVAEEEGMAGSLTWAVAGRSKEKLEMVLKQAAEATGKDLSDVGVILANVNDNQSMDAMCKQGKLLLNCVGPYRFYGEQVVRACIENGCHHVDISGEPQFLEGIQLNYNEKAKENNVIVIGACGFDSIPADMSVVFTKKKFPGVLNIVESFMAIQTGPKGGKGHFTTYQSAIYGFAHSDELPKLRQKFNYKPLPKYTPRLKKRGAIFYNEKTKKWCTLFPGSDVSVVRRSQRFLYENNDERPVQYGAYFEIGGFFSLMVLLFFGIIFAFLAKFSFGRKLLEKYPKLFTGGGFSHEGPTREQMDGTTFSFVLNAEGFSAGADNDQTKHDVTMVTKVTGPEPGYVATPIMMVQAGLVILSEKDNLPASGGVFSPAAAFSRTRLIERLDKRGIKFSVVETALPSKE
ncbi:saccharopine dehydrogenase-like oxidoreductase [Acanthaster planci]|uniref:Saccharopine dehydrogenase-like oxidoreductase n=1 Tax=Acanthaster planci TaxID=133434 RepID=A0A8B7YDF5_ACAPL|nr:saccharopine dehydrogenase-like oxidoreductase [Acanthaster planci]XP_022091290.1 saccharopine dehydrogenase-like oxidoreductase [Acanthaster planci]